jgi:hypothetical protein
MPHNHLRTFIHHHPARFSLFKVIAQIPRDRKNQTDIDNPTPIFGKFGPFLPNGPREDRQWGISDPRPTTRIGTVPIPSLGGRLEERMTTVLSAVIVLGLVVMGIVSINQSRRATTIRLRQRHIRWAMGAFGTLGIITFVTLLGETLQNLVMIAAIVWFARHLYRGTSPWVRFVEKKLADML